MAKANRSDEGGDAASLFLWGLVTGALVGTALALILAPTTGEQTRDFLRSKSREFGEGARGSANDASDRARCIAEDLGAGASGIYARGKQMVSQARESIDAAIDDAVSTIADENPPLHHETQ